MTVEPPRDDILTEAPPDLSPRDREAILADLLTLEGSTDAAERYLERVGRVTAEERIHAYFAGGAWRSGGEV